MASEDVIELGSSDDEPAESAPKKVKPLPNTMVQFPTTSTSLLIPRKVSKFPTTSTSLLTPRKVSNQMKVKNVVVKNSPLKPNPFATMRPIKYHDSVIKAGIAQGVHVMPKSVIKAGIAQGVHVMPKISKVYTNGPCLIQKKNNGKFSIPHIPIGRPPVFKKVQNPKFLTKLPPGIIVTRTTGQVKKRARPVVPETVVTIKKQKLSPKISNTTEVLTVDLDDDDTTESSRSHPAWCLKPVEEEVQPPQNMLEVINNKEPEPTRSIEIVIEDSPIKPPIVNVVNSEIGRVLEITIDDSPVKISSELNKNKEFAKSGSDEDNKKRKVPQSKKKLDYPKETVTEELSGLKNVVMEVPIETDLQDITCEIGLTKSSETNVTLSVPSKNLENQSVKKLQSSEPIIIEIDSPVKQLTEIIMTSDSDENVADNVKAAAIASVSLNIDSKIKNTEFNDAYQSFIDLCFKVENTDDMKKIVEKKIKAYYREVPKEYTESAEFIEMVSSKVAAINADPERLYLYIKDIVDELNLQRKIAKTKINAKEKPKGEVIQPQDVEDPVRYRQICKLEKTLKKLHRAIQKLEEQEVDFDDEAESVYLLTESEEGNSSKDSEISPETDKNTLLQRYKERLVRVHAKICKLTNTKMPSEPHVHIDARPGRPKGPVQRLERWINKKIPIGTPLPFPDFHDVVKCVREANEADKLGWTELDIMDEARDLFMRCGKKLQRRRQENEWRVASTILSGEIDPAESSSELKKQLNENKVLAATKEAEVINKYADRQNILKLEAQEIGDKEAEQSPVESDDEKSDDNVDPKNTHYEISDDDTSSENDVTKVSDNNKQDFQINKKPVDIIKPPKLRDETDKNDNKENKVILIEKNSQVLKHSNNDNDLNCNPQENEPISDGKISVNQLTDIIKLDNEDATLNIVGMSANNNPIKCKISTKDTEKQNYDNISDVGEPNKITKLYSDSDVNLTNESSNSDGLIAVSDSTKTSFPEARDVVTIDNSSCSESDENRRGKCDDVEFLDHTTKKSHDLNMDTSSPMRDKIVFETRLPMTMNDEYIDSIENILLASDDDSCSHVNVVGSIPADTDNLKQAVMTRQDRTLKKYDPALSAKTQDETATSDIQIAADVGSSVGDVVNDLMKEVIYGHENDTRANNEENASATIDIDKDDKEVDDTMQPEPVIETVVEKCDKQLSKTDLEESLQKNTDVEKQGNEMETSNIVEAKEPTFGFPSNGTNDLGPVETTISQVGDVDKSSNETVSK